MQLALAPIPPLPEYLLVTEPSQKNKEAFKRVMNSGSKADPDFQESVLLTHLYFQNLNIFLYLFIFLATGQDAVFFGTLTEILKRTACEHSKYTIRLQTQLEMARKLAWALLACNTAQKELRESAERAELYQFTENATLQAKEIMKNVVTLTQLNFYLLPCIFPFSSPTNFTKNEFRSRHCSSCKGERVLQSLCDSLNQAEEMNSSQATCIHPGINSDKSESCASLANNKGWLINKVLKGVHDF